MKRKSAFKSLTAVLAVSLVSGGIALLSQAGTGNVTASAATGETFKMDTVAAVRIPDADKQGDVSGIRFYAHMDEATKANAEEYGYGFLVFPQRYLPSELPENYNYHTQLLDKIDFEGDPAKIYENGDLFTANGVIAPVDTANYDEAFTCVAYVKTATAGEYTYATIDKDFSRNVLQVASAAYIAEPEHRSALKSAYELGTTNPVQIADGEDLELISKAVADGENFTDVKFELVNDITLRYGYTPIPENFAGEIKGNNKTVTGSFNADIAANGNVVTGTVTTTAKTPDKLVDIATEADLIGNATGSQKREILSKKEWAAEGLTGNYTGNALKIYGSEMQTNSLRYMLTISTYTDDEIAEIKATYKYVNFWIAKNEVGTSKGGLYNNDLTETTWDRTFTSLVWKKSTYTLDEYFTTVAGKETSSLIYTWTEAVNAPNAVIYFGDIEFVEDGDIGYYYDGVNTCSKDYLTAEEWADEGITGEYDGEALKLSISSAGNPFYYIKAPSAAELATIQQEYNKVSFWIARKATSGAIMYGLWNNTTTSPSGSSYTAAFGDNNVWHKFTLSVSDFVNYVTTNAADGKVKMLYIWGASADTAIYFGEIQFSFEPKKFADVESGNWSGYEGSSYHGAIYHNDLKNNYKTAEDLAGLEIVGENKGDAVETTYASSNTSGDFRVVNSLTDPDTLAKVQAKYSYVRFYIAVINQGVTGNWYYTAGNGLLSQAEGLTEGKYKFDASVDKQWVEFKIEINTFATYITENTTDTGYVSLFNRAGSSYWNGASNRYNLYFYISDIEFI